MPWLEYNLHLSHVSFNIIKDFDIVRDVIVDFIGPFISNKSHLYEHWNYLIEPDKCREKELEIRLRFESSESNLECVRQLLINELETYANRTNILMKENEDNGSHEGCHGIRNQTFQGASSETFEEDWPNIVEIMQVGSESAIKILELGRSLKTHKSLQLYIRKIVHSYYLHLPANQLIVEY